jgi:hypothetical protein
VEEINRVRRNGGKDEEDNIRLGKKELREALG